VRRSPFNTIKWWVSGGLSVKNVTLYLANPEHFGLSSHKTKQLIQSKLSTFWQNASLCIKKTLKPFSLPKFVKIYWRTLKFFHFYVASEPKTKWPSQLVCLTRDIFSKFFMLFLTNWNFWRQWTCMLLPCIYPYNCKILASFWEIWRRNCIRNFEDHISQDRGSNYLIWTNNTNS